MATLTGNTVGTSYLGLIKTTDNAVIGATEKNLTDGAGNASTLSVGTTSATITGNLDLTGATVTGLDAAGLVAGTGTGSMKSANTLTTTAPNAAGATSIALGNNAKATGTNGVGIGNGANAEWVDGISIGTSSWAQSTYSIAIGKSAHGRLNDSIAIGRDSQAANASGIALGLNAQTNLFLTPIAIGVNSIADANNAVALGTGVTASTVDTVSVKALETQTDSTPTAGGIIMSDAGGTDRRINITAAGELQIDSTPIGSATTFNTSPYVISAVASSDICYSVVTIPADTYADGDVVEFRSMVKRDSLNGTAYEGWYISEQAQIVGTAIVTSGTAKQICGEQSAGNGSLFYQKTLWLTTGNMTTWPYGIANETSNIGVVGGDPIETQTIDWTTTQYLYSQVWQDSTTGTLSNYGGLLRKIN
jgi:hypothetical protein